MIGDFGNRNPKKSVHTTEKVISENLTKHRPYQEAIAEQAIHMVGAKLETRKILVLVDLQGMYLGLHKWLSDKNFPIEGGLVLSRLATFQIQDVFSRIKERTLRSLGTAYADFEDVVKRIGQAESGDDIALSAKAYLRFAPQFEIFYAPAPFEDIGRNLRNRVKDGSAEVRKQLHKLEEGIIQVHLSDRDYAAYDDFVEKLKANIEFAKAHQGFFNFYVGPSGLRTFDEKAVDTRIVIRAMDTFYKNEADIVCIVSSDQDFMPVHERAQEFGIPAYAADLANFASPEKTARRLKNLGDRFLPCEIDPVWPLQIFVEASSGSVNGITKRQFYTISQEELKALCDLHNSMNELHMIPDFKPDGTASFSLYRPRKTKGLHVSAKQH